MIHHPTTTTTATNTTSARTIPVGGGSRSSNTSYHLPVAWIDDHERDHMRQAAKAAVARAFRNSLPTMMMINHNHSSGNPLLSSHPHNFSSSSLSLVLLPSEDEDDKFADARESVLASATTTTTAAAAATTTTTTALARVDGGDRNIIHRRHTLLSSTIIGNTIDDVSILERAVHRGSQRASGESNDDDHQQRQQKQQQHLLLRRDYSTDDDFSGTEFDGTSIRTNEYHQGIETSLQDPSTVNLPLPQNQKRKILSSLGGFLSTGRKRTKRPLVLAPRLSYHHKNYKHGNESKKTTTTTTSYQSNCSKETKKSSILSWKSKIWNSNYTTTSTTTTTTTTAIARRVRRHDNVCSPCYDAWMCGVCGKAFSSFEAADQHEDYHIREVVTDLLGGMSQIDPTTATTNATTAILPTTTPAVTNQSSRNHNHTPIVVAAAEEAGGLDHHHHHQQQQNRPVLVPSLTEETTCWTFAQSNSPLRLPRRQKHSRRTIKKETRKNYNNQPKNQLRNSSSATSNAGVTWDARNVPSPPLPPATLKPPPPQQQQQKQYPIMSLDGLKDLPEDALIPSPLLGYKAIRPRPTPPSPPHQEKNDEPDEQYWNQLLGRHNSSYHNTSGGGGGGDHRANKNARLDDTTALLLMPEYMKQTLFPADEALVDVCRRAVEKNILLTGPEIEAEYELHLLARDKLYYDQMAVRTASRTANPTNRYRADGKTLLSKVQNKLLDTYQLIKEGDVKSGGINGPDHYERKGKGGQNPSPPIEHTNKTIFVNVIVKNSIEVVRHELERLAKQRWEDSQSINNLHDDHFLRFRAITHGNLVKLAGLALVSDFTPRKVAVQLSNDLYWLLTPKLKRRGVTIETEIEYRIGPYFVLAVNVKTIDWLRLIKFTNKDVADRKSRWKEHQLQRSVARRNEGVALPPKANDNSKAVDEGNDGWVRHVVKKLHQLFQLTEYDILAHFLAFLYNIHWIFYYPMLVLAYETFLGPIVRKLIISSVADEIFYLVEEKGMEMEVSVRDAANQTAFMLSALRELRADGRELKKKRKETESAQKGTIVGPLLGPAIKADKGPAVDPAPGLDLPANLEYVGLELNLPVGFRRLRWALLSFNSQFLVDGVLRTEAKYDKITTNGWSKHSEYIGSTNLPPTVDPNDFIGAERETSYLMPKTVFVSANMCYETKYIVAYNDFFFCTKSKTLAPEVPYGSTFVAWTQMVVINTGHDSCKMICSVEAEFPNGPPLVSRQIKSGMRAGTAESFVLLGETINKYADEYP